MLNGLSITPSTKCGKWAGKLPATNIWLWGLGKRPKLESFKTAARAVGGMITAVDLLRGLATLIGWDRIEVRWSHRLHRHRLCGQRSGSHRGVSARTMWFAFILKPPMNLPMKVISAKKSNRSRKSTLTLSDQFWPHLDAHEKEWRILVSPDHPTYLSTKTHTHGNVPFTICGQGIEPDRFQTILRRNCRRKRVGKTSAAGN